MVIKPFSKINIHDYHQALKKVIRVSLVKKILNAPKNINTFFNFSKARSTIR